MTTKRWLLLIGLATLATIVFSVFSPSSVSAVSINPENIPYARQAHNHNQYQLCNYGSGEYGSATTNWVSDDVYSDVEPNPHYPNASEVSGGYPMRFNMLGHHCTSNMNPKYNINGSLANTGTLAQRWTFIDATTNKPGVTVGGLDRGVINDLNWGNTYGSPQYFYVKLSPNGDPVNRVFYLYGLSNLGPGSHTVVIDITTRVVNQFDPNQVDPSKYPDNTRAPYRCTVYPHAVASGLSDGSCPTNLTNVAVQIYNPSTPNPDPTYSFSCSPTGQNSIQLNYTAGQTPITLFRGATQLGSPRYSTPDSYSDTGLSAGTSYTYYLRKGSGAGEQAGTATCTTQQQTQTGGNPYGDCDGTSPRLRVPLSGGSGGYTVHWGNSLPTTNSQYRDSSNTEAWIYSGVYNGTNHYVQIYYHPPANYYGTTYTVYVPNCAPSPPPPVNPPPVSGSVPEPVVDINCDRFKVMALFDPDAPSAKIGFKLYEASPIYDENNPIHNDQYSGSPGSYTLPDGGHGGSGSSPPNEYIIPRNGRYHDGVRHQFYIRAWDILANGQPSGTPAGAIRYDDPVPCGTPPTDKKPYFRAQEADVIVGGVFRQNNTCPAPNTPGILSSWNQDATGYAGAGVEYAAIAANAITQVASGAVRSSGLSPPPRALTFANSDATKPYGGFYGDTTCVPDYFTSTQKDPAPALGSLTSFGEPMADGQFRTLGNTNAVTNGFTVPEGRQATWYIDGNLRISGDIKIAEGDGSRTLDSIPSFIVIVKGNIYVDPGVKQLDGVYIVQPNATLNSGTFYSCTPGGTPPNTDTEFYTDCGVNQLTINGAVIAQHLKLLRTYGTVTGADPYEPTTTPHNCYDGVDLPAANNTNCAAEIFNFTPEIFLARHQLRAISGPTNPLYQFIGNLPPTL